MLAVDDVTLTVSMELGFLKMKGEFILHWFQTQFMKVLDSFEKTWSSPQPLADRYSQMKKSWKVSKKEIGKHRYIDQVSLILEMK
jgi:hypothetical protein